MTPRALLIALVFTAITSFWVRQSEVLVLATQITESVPTIPGLAALTLLVALNAIVRRWPILARGGGPLSTAELTVVFLFVSVAAMVMGIGVVQFLLALMGNSFYKPIPGAGDLLRYYPPHLMPTDPGLLRQLYERNPGGVVPWRFWIVPGVIWCGFFVFFGWTVIQLLSLFFRAWAEDERLAFPLVALPIAMMKEEEAFYRSPLMWLGFGVSAVYNGINIWHTFAPAVPAIGKSWPLITPEIGPPWDAMLPVTIHFRPELLGFGFLVATEVSLTAWLTFLLNKVASAGARATGQQPNGLYTMEQGMGAFLALALFLIWQARRRLSEDIWGAVRLAVGFLGSWGFLTVAGVAPWLGGLFLLLVLAVALVYGRVRAQTGIPLIWLYPYHLQKEAILYTLGGAAVAHTGAGSVVSWSLFSVLSKGYFPTAVAALQVEGMEMARRERFPVRQVGHALLLAVGVGFALGWYHHIEAYYRFGAVNLRDGDIWGFWVADYETNMAITLLNNPPRPDVPKMVATGAGSAIALMLSLLSLQFVGFPLNPIGYAMSACFGDVVWFSFLVVWAVKVLLLRYGGMRQYKRAVPFFLGLALGHLSTAGVLWGVVGAFSPEAVRGYSVFFG